MITLDFETHPIVGNPLVNPPKPIGLAVYLSGLEPFYITDWDEMKYRWDVSLDSGEDLLFHHAQFDLSVGCQWFGTPYPSWERVHDTMFLCFLKDPYAKELGLKPSAQRYLGLDPEEQDELHEWILANVPEATRKTAGAFIYLAPIPLVRKYAIGDVVRTRGLFDTLYPDVPTGAYDRERRLAPILSNSSRTGIRVERAGMQSDLEIYDSAFEESTQRIFQLTGGREFNINSGPQLADALDKAGLVHTWFETPTGRRSTARDNLMKGMSDTAMVNLLAYRGVLKTCLGTFMRPWLEFSEADGRVHTEWNQVKHDEVGYLVGARTGRLSGARPNFMNIPDVFKTPPPEGLPELPQMRSYLLPEEGHIWGKRDFSSQEIRILAHFEDGELCQAYILNPNLDPHQMALEIIYDLTRRRYDRKPVKITGFSIIYGSGVPGLAAQLNQPKEEAYAIRQSYLKAMPAVEKMAKDVKKRGLSGEPIETWGGRFYYAEPGKEYKLLNYLIQGSAADQTKQVIADWHYEYNTEAIFLATVHDEINTSLPKDDWQYHMDTLRRAMEQDLFDAPMRSEGYIGPNWGTLEKVA